jgi:hypothetical protein
MSVDDEAVGVNNHIVVPPSSDFALFLQLKESHARKEALSLVFLLRK